MRPLAALTLATVLGMPVVGHAQIKLPPHSPAPYGVLPSPQQVAWHEMETYAFVHFTVNTFTNKEWGYGDESPAIFNPVDFDATKIVADIKAAGFKGVILTCKHHDGFCLWPSKYTEHGVKNSPWKNGKGDVVKEMSEACRAAGLKFGIYLSPWDRNSADYGTPAYVEYYHHQLRELLTNYGELFMVWLDGANGGDGYYGGAREKRSIDRDNYYDMPRIVKTVRELQPHAVIFGDSRADIRWIGNERGVSPTTNWATTASENYKQIFGDRTVLGTGQRNGDLWRPAETDVSIRPGWFYHEAENTRVKSPSQLLDIYYSSVGHGSDLNLNFPPTPQGLIYPTDAANAKEMRRILDATFAHNLLADATVTASSDRGKGFAAKNVLDNKADTFWAANDDAKTAELVFQTARPITFDVISLGEVIELGQRLDSFAVDAEENGAWHEIVQGESVGYKRLERLKSPITASKIRLRLNAPVAPVLSSFGLYLQPAQLTAPTITRDRTGLVSIQRSGGLVRYTLDGTIPNAQAPLYSAPIPLPYGGIVQTRTFDPTTGAAGEIASQTFGVSKTKWKIVSATAEVGPASNAIDDNPTTLWHTHDAKTGEIPPPQSLSIDFGEQLNLSAFTYLPRQDGTPRGLVTGYHVELSEDGQNWNEGARGEFPNVVANPILQVVPFATPQKTHYLRFTADKVAEANHVAVAELGIQCVPQKP